ncbi:MAG: DUF2442 domain-containing protein [Anaerolinea sp.]|nr:DUF2442 domain-containing protein [Anaerolinea sp.]
MGCVHEIRRVIGLCVVAPCSLWLMFDDGLERTIDFARVLRGELYGPLQDTKLFAAATIDPDAGTVTWPNGADFDPETLQNWPRYEDALRKRAQEWTAARS